MNEITKKPDKATSFQPTFNTKLEKDKNTSARMGHSLCYYLPKWSLWGEIMIYLKLNEVTFPWNVSLTRKLLCLKKSTDSVTLQENESSSQVTCICLEVIQEEKKTLPPPAYFWKPPFQKHHVAWDTVFLILLTFSLGTHWVSQL